MTSEKEQVFSEIRACIISSQGGVAATELNRDYKCLVGESIPYRRLGYSSLEAFLNEVPNVHVFQNKGEWWLEAKASGASHIQKLVQGQNKSKPRKPKRNVKFTPRSSAGQFTPKKSYSQVPHFMQTKTSFKPSPKPKTQYIPPSQNSDFSRNVPTKVISGKQASAKQSNNVSDNKSKPKLPTHMHHEIQSTGPLLSTQTQTTSRKSPLLPTPTTQCSPANPTLLKQPDLTALTPSGSNGHKSPAQTDFRKPQKSSVSSRLQAFKKKSPLDSLAESLGEIRMKSPTGQNGHIESRERARKVPKSQIPPKSVPVKFVQPIQHKNNQNTSKKGKLSNDMRYFPESAYDDSSYVIKLQRYAQERMLPQPEFFVLSRRIKKAGKLAFIYLGRISWVGPPDPSMPPNSVHEFSSYPAEFDDSRLAIEAVAKKAYTSLVESCSIQLPETSDPEVVIERVKQMIVGQPQGVWLFKIEREYMERYNEVLPKNFPELAMQHCRDIDVNTFAGIYSIVRLKDEMLPDRISQIIDRVHLPKDDTWDVFVSKVKSLNEIYVRLLHDRAAIKEGRAGQTKLESLYLALMQTNEKRDV